MNTQFHQIDVDNWNRKDEFEHFTQIGCTFSMTAEVDVSRLKSFTKEKNYKFYPTLIALCCQVVNEHKEYRYGIEGDKFGYYEVLHPLFFDAIDNYEHVKELFAEYSPILTEQLSNIERVRSEYKDCNDYIPQGAALPDNVINISCIPWVNFSSLSFSLPYAGKYFIPILTFGKYEDKDGKTLIPLSVHINHGVNDGFHGAMIYKHLQDKIDQLK